MFFCIPILYNLWPYKISCVDQTTDMSLCDAVWKSTEMLLTQTIQWKYQ